MIVILTDFGDDEYVGVMKGVIYSICENAKITDLFNYVKPQCVKEGAWILYNNYKFFPKGSIFLCVVDPGVGSERQGVVIKTKNYYFVGPDNGLMFSAAKKDGVEYVVKLDASKASKTFHGRDVFAKAAALLEKGDDVSGEETVLKEELEFDKNGEVVRIDGFGNIVTNIQKLKENNYTLIVNNKNLKLKLYNNYSEAPDDELFLVEGSCKTLEISVKNSSAAEKLKVEVGDKVRIN
ncbi:SAM-dependent chlorinase/fluorinase [Candidatus Woesearchaeota archaeon]|nr:SAM-dependent chlorinase/fluorinase [Candidatus Woesearchaeota archaeon]